MSNVFIFIRKQPNAVAAGGKSINFAQAPPMFACRQFVRFESFLPQIEFWSPLLFSWTEILTKLKLIDSLWSFKVHSSGSPKMRIDFFRCFFFDEKPSNFSRNILRFHDSLARCSCCYEDEAPTTNSLRRNLPVSSSNLTLSHRSECRNSMTQKQETFAEVARRPNHHNSNLKGRLKKAGKELHA